MVYYTQAFGLAGFHPSTTNRVPQSTIANLLTTTTASNREIEVPPKIRKEFPETWLWEVINEERLNSLYLNL